MRPARLAARMRGLLGLGLAAMGLLLASGCATDRGSDLKQTADRKALAAERSAGVKREAELNAAWRGHRYEELLASFGEPVSKINMIGQRPLPTTLVMFGVDAKTRCVDAFTMVKNDKTGQWSVEDYFCR